MGPRWIASTVSFATSLACKIRLTYTQCASHVGGGLFSGPPIQCTAACAGYFVSFWEKCAEKSGYNKADKVRFDAFKNECKATHRNDEGDGSIGKNVLDPKLCHIKRSAAHEHKFEWIEISPLQMDHCIGKTPQEQVKCGHAPPRKNVKKSDVGTLVRTRDWTSNGQTTWQGDDGWFDVKLPWGFMWYGKSEHTITIGTNGILTFGTPQYIYGGSERESQPLFRCSVCATVAATVACLTPLQFLQPCRAMPPPSARTVRTQALASMA